VNAHPALCGGNGKATDLDVVLSEGSGIVSVFLGTALLERLRCSPEALQYRMLVGRLVNAGWRPSELQGVFGRDPGGIAPPVLSDSSIGARPVGLHHAGLVLFALLLEVFCRRRPQARGLQTQWIGQMLQGAVNIEQSRLVSAADLSRFTGPVVPGTDPQRTVLHRTACLEAVLDVYAANARLIADGPGRGRAFYYDLHSKEYTGSLKVMKDWCGRRHGVAKVMHIDMIHTESGRPCFAQHYCPYYDLRERFFMTVGLFDRLFGPGDRSGRLFVRDRGIYGLETLLRFERDHVPTWEKGYDGKGWEGAAPDTVFQRTRARNSAADVKLYRFECREEPWRRDRRFRRILEGHGRKRPGHGRRRRMPARTAQRARRPGQAGDETGGHRGGHRRTQAAARPHRKTARRGRPQPVPPAPADRQPLPPARHPLQGDARRVAHRRIEHVRPSPGRLPPHLRQLPQRPRHAEAAHPRRWLPPARRPNTACQALDRRTLPALAGPCLQGPSLPRAQTASTMRSTHDSTASESRCSKGRPPCRTPPNQGAQLARRPSSAR
jgi:hypothetical protein